MGQKVSRTDFEWMYTEEPHATRRKIILEKHPEVKKLMGHDPFLKYKVSGMVFTQFILAWLFKDCSWGLIFILAYTIGGIINHSMTLAIHEIAHNLAFGHSRPLANRILGIFANLPLAIPLSISFKKYHLEHHRYQGVVDKDMDIPTKFEACLFTRSSTKLIWLFLQPLFYTLRPLIVRPKPITLMEGINIIIQLLFNVLLYNLGGMKPLAYFFFGSILSTGVHPIAGHFISEHYMFKKGYETYSYYGPLNILTFNVGYHNEHHDFPNIPGSRLPELKKLAPEFYDNLPCHTSWVKVLYDFIFDPDIGPYARIKRNPIPLPTDVEENSKTQ